MGPVSCCPSRLGNQRSSVHQLLPTFTGMSGPGNQSAPLPFFFVVKAAACFACCPVNKSVQMCLVTPWDSLSRGPQDTPPSLLKGLPPSYTKWGD